MTARRFLILLAVSLLAACAVLFVRLDREPYARGADAYYYVLQAEYWAATGEVKIPDASPIHRVTGFLRKAGLTGESAVRAWETFSLLTLGLAALALAFAKPDAQRMLLWFALAASPSALFTAIEFPKFFGAILWIPLWFLALGGKRAPRATALALAAVAVAFHRAALPFALGFAAVVFLPDARRFSARSLGVLGAAAVAAIGLAWFFGDRLAFQNARPGIIALLSRDQLPLALKLEAAGAAVVFVLFAIRRFKNPSAFKDLLFPAVFCLPALIPFGAEEVFGVGERYAVIVPVLLWIGCLAGGDPVANGDGHGRRLPPLLGVALGVMASLLPATVHWRLDAAHPKGLDPNNAAFTSLTREIEPLAPAMLIARKDFVFFYKAKRMREAFPYEPENHWDKARIWRLVYALTPEELTYFLPQRCGWETGLARASAVEGYAWMREDCWAELRGKIVKEDDQDLWHRAWETWLNPARKRPDFLYPKHRDDADREFPALPPR